MLIHRLLGAGLVLTAGVLIVLRESGRVPAAVTGEAAVAPAWVFVAASLLLFLVAHRVFRPRVPVPSPGEPAAAYWARRDVMAAALPFWALSEAGGVVAAVGYFLTGEQVAAAATIVAVVAFWYWGPGTFSP